MAAMEHQRLNMKNLDRQWISSKLPAVFAGDVAAAGISATLISPLITAIDRSVRIYLCSGYVINSTVEL
jgi:hypothetical protein